MPKRSREQEPSWTRTHSGGSRSKAVERTVDESRVESLLKERSEARAKKCYGRADEIADELVALDVCYNDDTKRWYTRPTDADAAEGGAGDDGGPKNRKQRRRANRKKRAKEKRAAAAAASKQGGAAAAAAPKPEPARKDKAAPPAAAEEEEDKASVGSGGSSGGSDWELASVDSEAALAECGIVLR